MATGALIGLGLGFVVGLTMPASDLSPSFVALEFGSIGAGIGALVGKATEHRSSP